MRPSLLHLFTEEALPPLFTLDCLLSLKFTILDLDPNLFLAKMAFKETTACIHHPPTTAKSDSIKVDFLFFFANSTEIAVLEINNSIT
jgi:hypothetical protein